VSRSLHLLRPEWQQEDPESSYEYVVESLRDGPRFLKVALELWRLADHEARAAAIEALLVGAYDPALPDYAILRTPQVQELFEKLEGLEDALRSSIVDAHAILAPERVAEVRSRTTLLDLGEPRGDLAVYGVAEGLSQVCELQDFLQQALDQDLHLALD
jgi:hypothetical protein